MKRFIFGKMLYKFDYFKHFITLVVAIFDYKLQVIIVDNLSSYYGQLDVITSYHTMPVNKGKLEK